MLRSLREWWRRWPRRAGPLSAASEQWAGQRQQLQDHFFQAAAASGKPRGLRWKSIEWGPDVAFAREKATGRLAALVGITVAFEAVEGSDMEDLPAVGNLRNA